MRKLVRFSSILLLAAVLFSCKQNISYDESKSQGKQGLGQQTEKQADKADEYVNVKLAVNKAAREAFVPNEDGSKNYSFDLTGYLDGSKNLTTIMHWDNFDAIAGSEFQIKRGSWELILTASAGDYNESTKEWNVYPVLEGTCSKTITKAETIPFKLEKIPASEAPGEYFMYLHFPKSENWAISASVKDLATLNVLDEQYNPSIRKDSDDFAEIHGKLPAGEYKLGVKFVYKSGSLEMTSVVPVFMVIAPGCQTHGDISLDCDKLNMAHPIIYADYDAEKGNYSLPDGFPTVFTSYESYTLPTPTRTDSENYEFVGWFTDGGFGKDSKIEKTPLYTENGELELVLYPKWLAKTSPYFSLEDEEGINFVLSDKTKELFANKQASSLQYFIRNTDTNLEVNIWFSSEEIIEMNYEWNYPFVENGTDYEAYLIIGDINGDIRTENLGITTKTGIGEDKHFYDEADYELDNDGILHITNIPEYTDYDSDSNFKENYVIAIWEGSGWDDSPEWKDNNVWENFQKTSLDFDLNPWLEKHQLYGKPFMTLCSRDYWYKGKKYGIGFGSPTFTYGDLNHEYKNTEEDGPKPTQDLIVFECDDSYDNYIAFATPISARSGYTTVNVEWSVEPSANATQVGFQLQNENDNCKCGSTFCYNFIEDFKDYAVSTASCFVGSTYTAYDEDGSYEENCSDGATRIQFFFQNANDAYKPVSGKVYIKRVWLSGKGLDSKLILLNPNSNSGNSSVEEDGPFVLKCNNDYNNFIDLKVPIKEGSGYTTINAEIKWEADNGVRAGFELRDADYVQASSTVKFSTDYSVVSGKCLYGSYYDDWSTGEAKPVACSDSAVRLQMFIEERTEDGYEATEGTIYIKRIWLSGEGKDDLNLKLDKSYSSMPSEDPEYAENENLVKVSYTDDGKGNPRYKRYFRQYGISENINQFQTLINVDRSKIESKVSLAEGQDGEEDALYVVDEENGIRNMRASLGLIFDLHCTKEVEESVNGKKTKVRYYDFVLLAYRPSDDGFYIEKYSNVSENMLNAITNNTSVGNADVYITQTQQGYEYAEDTLWVSECFGSFENEEVLNLKQFTVTVTQSTPGTYCINMAGKDYYYTPEDDSSEHPDWYDKNGYRIGAVGYYANAPLGTTVYATFYTETKNIVNPKSKN